MSDPATPDQPTRSPWWLALRVIDEPAAVFRSLTARPTVYLPLLLLVFVAGVVAVGTPQTTLRRAAEQQVALFERRAGDRIPEEQRSEMVARMLESAGSPAQRATIFAGGAVTGVLVLLVVALVLQLIFGTMATEPLRFSQELAIVTHAYVPQLLGALLVVALDRFTAMEQVAFNLGFLFDGETSPFLSALGSRFGLFGAWNVLLLALGNQIRTGAKSLGAPLAIVGGLWVLVNLGIATLMAALGGMIGG